MQKIEQHQRPLQPLVHLVDTLQTLIESIGDEDLVVRLKIPVSLTQMACFYGYDVLHQSRIQVAGHIPHLDELTDANRGPNSVHLLLGHFISQHKQIAREEWGGPYPDLTLADGLLWIHRAVGRHALLLEVRHGSNFMLWLGLHHPPGLIAGHILGLDVDTLFPLEC